MYPVSQPTPCKSGIAPVAKFIHARAVSWRGLVTIFHSAPIQYRSRTMSLYSTQSGGNVMKKLITTILIGLPLLAATSLVQAHSPGHGGIRGSVSIAVPIGYGGYLAYGTAPYYYPQSYYYPAPYGYRDYSYGYRSHSRHGYGHGNRYESRYGYRHSNRHGRSHDESYGYGYGYGNNHGHDRYRGHDGGRDHDRRGHH